MFGVVLGIIILYSFVYVPISGLDLGFGDQMATRQKQLAQVRSMMHTYGRLKTELAATEKRTVPSKDFSLFSVIEQSLTKSVGRDKIGSITPSDRSVPGGFQQYTIDLKLAHHQKKRAALNDLFQTLLHKLMTAEIRVNELDIDTSEVASAAA